MKKETPPRPQVARLSVLVPRRDAKLFFFESQSSVTGERRTFTTVPLTPGKKYFYSLRVVWEPNNYTRITRRKRVELAAGGSYTVDLRKADDKHPDDIRVRFVPTPNEVVDEMLKLAKVGRDDVVFDLGCGDGRMVIRAVKNFGAKRGVGVDIDPQRIKESKANAQAGGVQDKVKFREGDVLKQIDDLAEASVVLLYMGQDVNLRLRPVLREKLKPGARVVSHHFTMGDWKADNSIKVKDRRGFQYHLHLWQITKEEKE